MNKENIIRIAKYFKSSKIRVGSDYVMFNCPFAKALHKNKTDRNPSFSITYGSDTSAFHCFGCGVKGTLKKLPYALTSVYKKRFTNLQSFINKYENTAQIIIPKKEELKEIPDYKLEMFPLINRKWKAVEKKTLQQYNIREYNGQIIFPIYKYKSLVGLKFRVDRKFMTVGKFKQFGAFFGMQFKLSRKKFLFIVEGERDTMILKQIGITNVWGLSGGISKSQIEELKKVSVPIVLFLDNDDAGIKMFETILKEILPINDVYHITEYFNCKDPAEIYEKGGIHLLRDSLKSLRYWGSIVNFSS